MAPAVGARTVGRLPRWYPIVPGIAYGWAVANCAYVYLLLGGQRVFRLESAVYILVASLLPVVPMGASSPVSGSLVSRRAVLYLSAGAVGLWLFALAPLVRFPFLSDDFVFLDRYTTISNALHSPFFFRPLFAVTFVALSKLGGSSPLPFHLVAFALHGACAWLVYSLARQFFQSAAAAAVCLVVFLLNPLQLEATLWVSGLQELLWTFFLLAALRTYVWSRHLSPARWCASILLVACALLSKETAVCFVLLLPAADLAFWGADTARTRVAPYVSCAGLAVAYLLVRGRFAGLDPRFFAQPTRYFWKQFVALPYHFFAQPWSEAAFRAPNWGQFALSLGVITLVFAAAMRGRARRLAAGAAFVLIATLPMYGYFYVGANLAGARYLYFATIGWGLVVATTLQSAAEPHPPAFVALAATIAVLLTSALVANLAPWRTAGRVVSELESGVRAGTPPAVIIARLRREIGSDLVLQDGVPHEYAGVAIFANGYREFLRRQPS